MKKFLFLAALVVFAANGAQAQWNGVTAELTLDQDQYLTDEALQLKVRILNRSGQVVTLGADNSWLSMSIMGDRGGVCSVIGEMPVKGEFSLNSGEVGTRRLNPTPYFDFRLPGHYKINAQIHIPQWNQDIACKPASFTVIDGIPLPGLDNLQFGMPLPPGATNRAPEVRRYSLLKANYLRDLKLYFRLCDQAGRTLRVFPIAPMISFSSPEAQIDRFNNLNVFLQTGARTFQFCVLDPAGNWVARQYYVYTTTRPVLRLDEQGNVFIKGGARVLTANDFPAPPPSPESADRK